MNPVALFTHFVFYNYLSSTLLKRYANCACVCICESQGCVNVATGHFNLPNGYNFIGYGHYRECSKVMWPHIITIRPVPFSPTV